MIILGIETSCDETAAAVVENGTTLLSNVVASSLALHAKTGGIIPEVAARQQVRAILPVIDQALHESNLYPPSSKIHLPSSIIHRPAIDAIAVTVGPGLIGSLLVGIETARTLAYVWKKPIVPVNHLFGHIYANWIYSSCHPELARPERGRRVSGSHSRKKEVADQVRNDKIIDFPCVALVVSGGHTDLVLMKAHGDIRWLGGTRDDAAGEAFDKIGRLLNLPYPGGPAIEKAAKNGNPKAFPFPRPMIDSDDFDFSFSGLKTAVMRSVILRPRQTRHEESPRSFPVRFARLWRGFAQGQDDTVVADLAASVQQAITDVLITKTIKAAQKFNARSILLSGGVAANQKLRDQFELDAAIFVPQKSLCTDNAAMVACAAFFNYHPIPWQKITANPELYFD